MPNNVSEAGAADAASTLETLFAHLMMSIIAIPANDDAESAFYTLVDDYIAAACSSNTTVSGGNGGDGSSPHFILLSQHVLPLSGFYGAPSFKSVVGKTLFHVPPSRRALFWLVERFLGGPLCRHDDDDADDKEEEWYASSSSITRHLLAYIGPNGGKNRKETPSSPPPEQKEEDDQHQRRRITALHQLLTTLRCNKSHFGTPLRTAIDGNKPRLARCIVQLEQAICVALRVFDLGGGGGGVCCGETTSDNVTVNVAAAASADDVMEKDTTAGAPSNPSSFYSLYSDASILFVRDPQYDFLVLENILSAPAMYFTIVQAAVKASVVEAILSYAAAFNTNSSSSVSPSSISVLSRLANNNSPNAARTPLINACMDGVPFELKKLLLCGADPRRYKGGVEEAIVASLRLQPTASAEANAAPDGVDKTATPAHATTSVPIIINYSGEDCMLPIHWAAFNGHAEAIQTLLLWSERRSFASADLSGGGPPASICFSHTFVDYEAQLVEGVLAHLRERYPPSSAAASPLDAEDIAKLVGLVDTLVDTHPVFGGCCADNFKNIAKFYFFGRVGSAEAEDGEDDRPPLCEADEYAYDDYLEGIYDWDEPNDADEEEGEVGDGYVENQKIIAKLLASLLQEPSLLQAPHTTFDFDIDARQGITKGPTALHRAVWSDRYGAAAALLRAGADVNATFAYGNQFSFNVDSTCVGGDEWDAVRLIRDHTKSDGMMRLLLDHGADTGGEQ